MSQQNPPYTPARRSSGYTVRSGQYPVGAIRPNRVAAGMSFTGSRSGSISTNPDIMALRIRGTTDVLRGMLFRTVRKPCPCCGHKTGIFALNEAGYLRLRKLRRLRAERLAGAGGNPKTA